MAKRRFFPNAKGRASSRMAELHARRERAEQRRIPLTEVARITGVDSRTLSQWYRDSIEVYHGAVIAALCLYYKCSVSDLLSIEEESESSGVMVFQAV